MSTDTLTSPNGFASAAVAHAEAHERRRLAERKASQESQRHFDNLYAEFGAEGRAVPDWVYDFCGDVYDKVLARELAR